jgi:hypothetical protein
MAKKQPIVTAGEVGIIALILLSMGAAYVLYKKIPVDAMDCFPCST